MKYYSKSDIGRIRTKNQDSYMNFDEGSFCLLIVADGMGGHKAGEVASKLAVDAINDYILNHYKDTDINEELLISAIKNANNQIRIKAKDQDYFNMGTTVVAAIVDSNQCFIANVGDSRIYLMRDSQLQQLTKDHSYINDLLIAGTITPEEAQKSKRKNMITRALGMEGELRVDTSSLELCRNDLLLLCTDGLTNSLDDDSIQSILREEKDISDKTDRLIDQSKIKGGEDNITATLFLYDGVNL